MAVGLDEDGIAEPGSEAEDLVQLSLASPVLSENVESSLVEGDQALAAGLGQ